MRTLDLFCGCGGMSLGFQHAGFEIVAAYDNWKPALKTQHQNFSHPAIECDLATLEDFSDLANFAPEMIIGGPPCQDFSSAGKRDANLGRADLTLKFAQIVAAIAPRWFVMENVDLALKSNAYRQSVQLLEAAGYGLTEVVLDASLCGVPQRRKRLFLIGERGGVKNALQLPLEAGLNPQAMTVRDYLGESLNLEFYYRHPRSYARRGIFSIDEPSPTIRGVNRPIPSTYKLHAGDPVTSLEGVRPLTTLERARLQTFPKDFVFSGGKTDLEQQIGNAVPVNLAAYVAGRILEFVRHRRPPVQENLFAPFETT
jgi:DNA (cytosine-5)-methyltransferase 1